MTNEDFNKFFKMAKLKPKNLDFFINSLNQTLDMMKIIHDVNVDGEVPYEKEWISSRLREDKIVIDENIRNFGNKQHGFFVVPVVVKG
jgi:Asp-tRNA(Asn)/Glu-tRNA(Gln) amidotransferase C subunit